MGRLQSGQMQRTVNPSSFDFDGSNPSLPTKNDIDDPLLENIGVYVAFFMQKFLKFAVIGNNAYIIY